jgi:hypothetical protein
MPWSRKLSETIALWDGRKITTLSDAREMMFSISLASRRDARWCYLADLLKEAAADNSFAARRRRNPVRRT